MEFDYEGGGLGKGGPVGPYIDGKQVGQGASPGDSAIDLLRR